MTESDNNFPSHFEREHAQLDALLQAHLLDVVGGDFATALTRLHEWRQALDAHIAIEETRLLPHVPAGARWDAKIYRLEHERIALLAGQYQQRAQAAARQVPSDAMARRRLALKLLDAAHALRHVLEHHHQREQMALAHELPADLQAAAWESAGCPGGGPMQMLCGP